MSEKNQSITENEPRSGPSVSELQYEGFDAFLQRQKPLIPYAGGLLIALGGAEAATGDLTAGVMVGLLGAVLIAAKNQLQEFTDMVTRPKPTPRQ